MHRTVRVCSLDIDEWDGGILGVSGIGRPEHMPVGTVDPRPRLRSELNGWWTSRAIPRGRDGIRDVTDPLGLADMRSLLMGSLGLSLSDQYWVRPIGSDLAWEDVNLFDNPFSENLGDLLFGRECVPCQVRLPSPDLTTDGVLRKRWRIVRGKRCLLKSGTEPYGQEPYNEVAASMVMESLGIPHVTYTLGCENGRTCCICEDFVDRDSDLVTAGRICGSRTKDNSSSPYRHLVDACSDLGADIVPFLDRMIVLDFILANDDRHLNNFGLLRDAESLEWTGPAPIYDTGSSLGCRLPAERIRPEAGNPTKPFRRDHFRQMELVTDLGWVDVDALARVPGIVREVLSGNGIASANGRLEGIVGLVEDRVSHVLSMM